MEADVPKPVPPGPTRLRPNRTNLTSTHLPQRPCTKLRPLGPTPPGVVLLTPRVCVSTSAVSSKHQAWSPSSDCGHPACVEGRIRACDETTRGSGGFEIKCASTPALELGGCDEPCEPIDERPLTQPCPRRARGTADGDGECHARPAGCDCQCPRHRVADGQLIYARARIDPLRTATKEPITKTCHHIARGLKTGPYGRPTSNPVANRRLKRAADGS